jgi:hypothetical protein
MGRNWHSCDFSFNIDYVLRLLIKQGFGEVTIVNL